MNTNEKLVYDFKQRVREDEREDSDSSNACVRVQQKRVIDRLNTLERELTEARGLLKECKHAFLGYPQEMRRSPLDLLRDLNRVAANSVLNQGDSK